MGKSARSRPGRSLIASPTSPKRYRGVLPQPRAALGACGGRDQPSFTSPKRQRGVVVAPRAWRLGLVAGGISHLSQAPVRRRGATPPGAALGVCGGRDQPSFTSPKRQRGVLLPPRACAWGLWGTRSAIFHKPQFASAGCYPNPARRLGLVAGTTHLSQAPSALRGALPPPRAALGVCGGRDQPSFHKPQASAGCYPHPALALGVCGGRDQPSFTSPKRLRGVLPPPHACAWGLWRARSAIFHKPQCARRGATPHPTLALGACGGRDQPSFTNPKRQRGVVVAPALTLGACGGRDQPSFTSPSACAGCYPHPALALGVCGGRDQPSFTSPKCQRAGCYPHPRDLGLVAGGISHLSQAPVHRAGCYPHPACASGLWGARSALFHKPTVRTRGATPTAALGACGGRDQPSFTSPSAQRGVLPPPRAGASGLWRAGISHLSQAPVRRRGVLPPPRAGAWGLWRAGSAIFHKPQAPARGGGSTPRRRLGLVAGGISHLSQAPSASAGCVPPPALALGACGGRDQPSFTSPKRERGVLLPPRAGAWGLWGTRSAIFHKPQAPPRGATPTPRWRLGLVAGGISHLSRPGSHRSCLELVVSLGVQQARQFSKGWRARQQVACWCQIKRLRRSRPRRWHISC